MKTRSIILAVMAAASLLAVSCKKNNATYMQATATIKNLSNGSCILQIDDKTVALPRNMKANVFKKEVRVFAHLNDYGAIDGPDGSPYLWRDVEVIQIDSIRTKKPVDAAVSNAGIEIYNTWVNTIEDGYLTLAFEAQWGLGSKVHFLNLETTENPMVFKLKHDNNGDSIPAYVGSGMIAFDLHEYLPRTESDHSIIIEYRGYHEAKAIEFRYTNGRYTGPYSKQPNLEMAKGMKNLSIE